MGRTSSVSLRRSRRHEPVDQPSTTPHDAEPAAAPVTPTATRSAMIVRFALATLWTLVIMGLCWMPGGWVQQVEEESSWFQIPEPGQGRPLGDLRRLRGPVAADRRHEVEVCLGRAGRPGPGGDHRARPEPPRDRPRWGDRRRHHRPDRRRDRPGRRALDRATRWAGWNRWYLRPFGSVSSLGAEGTAMGRWPARASVRDRDGGVIGLHPGPLGAGSRR